MVPPHGDSAHGDSAHGDSAQGGSARDRSTQGGAEPVGAPSDAEIEELCRLILGLDRDRLRAALERLDDRGAFTEMQSRTLAEAMRLALARDPAFVEAMGHLISRGVHFTVERDSAAFGRALAPAMGPAIRNSVRLMLQGFLSSIENVVDERLSWRSVQWRFEAWRTGRKFAEVVFRHTLLYRVEHVFLVHREDGVQLAHASPPNVMARDPDLIAAMLTAIQDFVRDAFEVPTGDTLTSFAVGDLRVGVESGSHAVIAAVVRGKPPAELRLQLREALDRIESSVGPMLARFDGDIAPFEAVLPHLEACLTKSELPGRATSGKPRRRLVPWVICGAVLWLLAWLVIGWVDESTARSRFAAFVADLEREPGYVITRTDAEDSRWVVQGLRDPLSRAPEEIASGHLLDREVAYALRPHHALHEPFVERRLQAALRPPAGVTVRFTAGEVVLVGTADHDWCRSAGVAARVLPGVETVDATALRATEDLDRERAAAAVTAADWSFVELARGYGADHRRFVEHARELVQNANVLGGDLTIRCELVIPFGVAEAAALARAREVVTELGHSIGVPIEMLAARADAAAGEQRLRFEVAYSGV
ncbi:MAG: hypothetical protein NXI31_26725 [bacterium]|nr:hypothetical protein [bacterium]